MPFKFKKPKFNIGNIITPIGYYKEHVILDVHETTRVYLVQNLDTKIIDFFVQHHAETNYKFVRHSLKHVLKGL